MAFSVPVRQFDALSARWDAEHGPGSARGFEFRARIDYLRARCRELGRPRTLDLGCGTGETLVHLRDQIASGIGVDISPGMIACARENASASDLRFLVADAASYCMNCPARFDLILLVGSIEHVPDQGAVLTGIRRVLANRGRLIVISPHPWNPVFRIKQLLNSRTLPPACHLSPVRLSRLAARAGLRLCTLCALPYAPYPFLAPRSRRAQTIPRPGKLLTGLLSGSFATEFVPVAIRNNK